MKERCACQLVTLPARSSPRPSSLFLPQSWQQLQLTQVVSGLSSPLFVGHAGDGSQRLFIVERGGIIKVLQPGSTVPTVFLDIRTRILSGGEQGLLGLAFHPSYGLNGRFFVFYTRAGDGALVIAEYKASTANPNVADTAEIVLLTIPHPTNANHNGGMLAFGPDNYLYIGVGDGGRRNDPAEQRPEHRRAARQDSPHRRRPGRPGRRHAVLVARAKSLSRRGGSATKSSPSAGATRGDSASTDRPASSGWPTSARAPARKSTRRCSQAATTAGGSTKGSRARTTIPRCAIPANYVPPVFDYSHSGGRCSITGGYVYRGIAGQQCRPGTYVYGDYCTGEIFAWNGTTQTLLLDTTLNISSFGEDESGELYVVGLGGTVSRIVRGRAHVHECHRSDQPQPHLGGRHRKRHRHGRDRMLVDGCGE